MSFTLEKLIHKKISRRKLLKDAGKVSAFIAVGAILPKQFLDLGFAFSKKLNQSNISFNPISPSSEDKFILPDGFNYSIIRKWGDKINDSDYFGYNNDFVAYIPIDFLDKGKNSTDGLLVVNHEFPSPLFINGYTDDDFRASKLKTPEQVEAEKKSVGLSIFRVKMENGQWNFIDDEKYSRRIDANTEILLCGKAAETIEMKNAKYARGTLANCSGGLTPWGTVLSGEENFQDYFHSEQIWYYRWNDVITDFIDEHYGWIVEVDPFDKNSVPKKRTSLGRFRHENVAINISPDKKVIAYMGDDRVNECVYKFISHNHYDETNRINNMDLLDEGDLYAADFKNNKWLLMDYEKNGILNKEFKSQADVLVNCDRAAKLIGATECNRPEDVEVNPIDGSVFVSFTNNTKKDDYHGCIIRIIEKENNPESLGFDWEVFATGGVASGFSCPDNLTFDSSGNLWTLCDISAYWLNKKHHIPFKNNSLFMIPTSGENKGKAFQFASGPIDCEMCGANFTPDETTMFLSIQHPGENSLTRENPTSRWPDFGNALPKPAVVAITGFKK